MSIKKVAHSLVAKLDSLGRLSLEPDVIKQMPFNLDLDLSTYHIRGELANFRVALDEFRPPGEFPPLSSSLVVTQADVKHLKKEYITFVKKAQGNFNDKELEKLEQSSIPFAAALLELELLYLPSGKALTEYAQLLHVRGMTGEDQDWALEDVLLADNCFTLAQKELDSIAPYTPKDVIEAHMGALVQGAFMFDKENCIARGNRCVTMGNKYRLEELSPFGLANLGYAHQLLFECKYEEVTNFKCADTILREALFSSEHSHLEHFTDDVEYELVRLHCVHSVRNKTSLPKDIRSKLINLGKRISTEDYRGSLVPESIAELYETKDPFEDFS